MCAMNKIQFGDNTAEVITDVDWQDSVDPSAGGGGASRPTGGGIYSGRIPPHSLEAEQSVLGAILIDNECLSSINDESLAAEDFYKKSHQSIFETMKSISDKGDPIDALTLSNELKKENKLQETGGIEYISALIDIVPTAANAAYYAKIIKDFSLRRKLIHEASEIVNSAFADQGETMDLVDSIEQRILKISESRANSGIYKVSDLIKSALPRIEQRIANKGAITGVQTGLVEFDRLTSGLQASDLIIIAGRPSMGKTALALSMLRNIAIEHDKRVVFFSLEMSKEQILERIISMEARVSSSKIRSGNLSEGDFPRLIDASCRIAKIDVMIDDTPQISPSELRAKARRLHKERKLDIIFIDYLQLMRGNSFSRNERREQEISEISRGLKGLAKELNVPIVAMSQLNRAVESRTDKRPMMADLRESGAIEQDADIIGFVYRNIVYSKNEEDEGMAELIIGKHRNGQIGTIELAFHGEYTSFENLAREVEEYDYLGSELDIMPSMPQGGGKLSGASTAVVNDSNVYNPPPKRNVAPHATKIRNDDNDNTITIDDDDDDFEDDIL